MAQDLRMYGGQSTLPQMGQLYQPFQGSETIMEEGTEWM